MDYLDTTTSALKQTPPAVCNRCHLTQCAFIHNIDSTPKCLSRHCDACTDLSAVNDQIDAVHQQLEALLLRRQEVKSRVNRQHDQLTNRLPLEIISEIFYLAADSISSPECLDIWDRPDSFMTVGPLLLGGVCKGWRDITLGLPRLWSTFNVKYWDDGRINIRLAEQWLQRSSTVPLAIRYSGQHFLNANDYSSIKRLRNILRSHAARWKRFSFCGKWEHVYDLFHNLDIIPQVDTLEIWIIGTSIQKSPITLERALEPINLAISAVRLSNVPLRYGNLTRLDAYWLQLRECLYIIRNGPNLTECVIQGLLQDPELGLGYGLPTAPIVHQSISSVKMDSESGNLLEYLVLPSLKIFIYVSYSSMEALDTLVDFMERSAATFDTFQFTACQDPLPPFWYERLRGITRLEFLLRGDLESESTGCGFFRAFADTSSSTIFPNLQVLNITTENVSKLVWSTLCEAVIARGDNSSIQDVVLGSVAGHTPEHNIPEKNYRRSLTSVWIETRDEDIMWTPGQISQPDIISSIEHIRALGVAFEVVDSDRFHSDVVDCVFRLAVNSLLPFSNYF